MRVLFLSITTLLCLSFSVFVTAKTAVVVSSQSPIHALDKQTVSNIFLARTSRFPNGEKAIPIEFKQNDHRADFYQAISGKTTAQLNAYWTTLIFTGKGKPPKSYSAQQDVLVRLQEHPGVITYMPIEQVTDQMKVLYVFD